MLRVGSQSNRKERKLICAMSSFDQGYEMGSRSKFCPHEYFGILRGAYGRQMEVIATRYVSVTGYSSQLHSPKC